MATGRKSKGAKLQSMHDYLHKKVEAVEKERNGDRSYNSKHILLIPKTKKKN